MLRPEQVHLVAEHEGLSARVVDRSFYEHDASLRLDVTCPGDVHLPVACRTQGELPAGDTVGVRIVGPVIWFPAVA